MHASSRFLRGRDLARGHCSTDAKRLRVGGRIGMSSIAGPWRCRICSIGRRPTELRYPTGRHQPGTCLTGSRPLNQCGARRCNEKRPVQTCCLFFTCPSLSITIFQLYRPSFWPSAARPPDSSEACICLDFIMQGVGSLRGNTKLHHVTVRRGLSRTVCCNTMEDWRRTIFFLFF